MTNPPAIPDAYSSVLQVKLKRDRQSYADFRQVDQRLHDATRKQQIESAIREIRESIHDYRVDITGLESDAAKARSVFSLAGEHATAAEKYALVQRQEWELVRNDVLEDGRAPDEVVEAEMRMEKAEKVAARRRAEAEPARVTLEETEAALAEERAELAEAERQLAGFEKAAGLTARAPLSDVTMRTFTELIRSDDEIRESLTADEANRLGWISLGLFQG